MRKLRSVPCSNTLLTSNKGLPSIFRSKMTQLIKSLLNLSTTIRNAQNLKSCLWENLRVSINLAPREFKSKLNERVLKSELEVATCLSMSSLISIPRSSWRNLNAKTLWKDSARRLPYRKLLQTKALEKNRRSRDLLEDRAQTEKSPFEIIFQN